MTKIHKIDTGICAIAIPALDAETHLDAVKRAIVSLCEYVDGIEELEDKRLSENAPRIAEYLRKLK